MSNKMFFYFLSDRNAHASSRKRNIRQSHYLFTEIRYSRGVLNREMCSFAAIQLSGGRVVGSLVSGEVVLVERWFLVLGCSHFLDC